MSELDLLKIHPFCHGLSEAQMGALAPLARVARFPEGAFIFREGSEADVLYLVVHGRVVLQQHVPGKGDVQLETLRDGDILGLSWLFPDGHWVLDARAAQPTDTLALDGKGLHALMEREPRLGLHLTKHIISQLYQRLERVRLQRLDVYRKKK